MKTVIILLILTTSTLCSCDTDISYKARDGRIDISSLDKKELLFELYKNSRTAAFFEINGVEAPFCSKEEIDDGIFGSYIDYFCGRPIKTNLKRDYAIPDSYDRENGKGSFQIVVDHLRSAQRMRISETMKWPISIDDPEYIALVAQADGNDLYEGCYTGIDISALDKKELLFELYEHSSQRYPGLNGVIQGRCRKEDIDDVILNSYINTFCGRSIFTDLSKKCADPFEFDVDNGHGTFQYVVDRVRKAQSRREKKKEEIEYVYY